MVQEYSRLLWMQNYMNAVAVVLNAPVHTEMIRELSRLVDIPIVLTVVSLDEDLEERMLHSGARIINVSGGKQTVEIVKALRAIDKDFPIIATGGPTEDTIKEVIEAGANAVTFTPPTSAEIFKGMMENYREQMKKQKYFFFFIQRRSICISHL